MGLQVCILHSPNYNCWQCFCCYRLTAGVCIKGELQALGIDGVQNRLRWELPAPTKHRQAPLSTAGSWKGAQASPAPGLLQQAGKPDCQKLQEAFISSLTHQPDNWSLLQVQGTLIPFPGHGCASYPAKQPQTPSKPSTKSRFWHRAASKASCPSPVLMTPRGLKHTARTCHNWVGGFLCQWHISLLLKYRNFPAVSPLGIL